MKRIGIEWGRVIGPDNKTYRRLALFAEPRIDLADSRVVRAFAAAVIALFALWMLIITDLP